MSQITVQKKTMQFTFNGVYEGVSKRAFIICHRQRSADQLV